MRKLEDLEPVDTKANEGLMKVCVDVEDLSNTAALPRRSWRRLRSLKRLSLREKIDYMANVEKL